QGAAFGWLLLVLWRWPDRFAIGGFLCGLGFLTTVNLLNPDADVAAYNLARRDELSTRFLYLLSDDAVPVLAAGLQDAPPEARAPAAVAVARIGDAPSASAPGARTGAVSSRTAAGARPSGASSQTAAVVGALYAATAYSFADRPETDPTARGTQAALSDDDR